MLKEDTKSSTSSSETNSDSETSDLITDSEDEAEHLPSKRTRYTFFIKQLNKCFVSVSTFKLTFPG